MLTAGKALFRRGEPDDSALYLLRGQLSWIDNQSKGWPATTTGSR